MRCLLTHHPTKETIARFNARNETNMVGMGSFVDERFGETQ
jgi:hypothetical protein